MFIGQDWEVRGGFSLLTSQESTLCFSEQKHSAVRVFAGSLGLACRASKTARCKVQFMQLPEVLNVWVSHVQNLPKGDVKHTEQSRTEFGSMKNGAGTADTGDTSGHQPCFQTCTESYCYPSDGLQLSFQIIPLEPKSISKH